MPSRTDTAHTRDVLIGLRRRRESTYRLPVLECGCADPWTCHHHDGEPSAAMIDAARAAAEHLLGTGLTPLLDLDAQRAMWRRGGDDRRLVSALQSLTAVA